MGKAKIRGKAAKEKKTMVIWRTENGICPPSYSAVYSLL